MTDKARELLEQAWEELLDAYEGSNGERVAKEIRAYLAEPEVKPQPFNQTEFDEMVRKGTEAWKDYKPEQDEEPFGYVEFIEDAGLNFCTLEPTGDYPYQPIYLHPAPRKPFVRLSEEEIREVMLNNGINNALPRAIEDALEEKNK